MNMSPSFAASFADARPVAQHCQELTQRGPRPEERAEILSAWCRDLGYDLSQELGQLFSAGKLKVEVSEPEELSGNDVFEKIGPVAANSLLRCGDDGQVMLFSLDLPTAIALTDSSFGGEGVIPSAAPEQLPRSVGLLVEELASLVARVIAMSNGSSERISGDVLVRSESVTRLKPFEPSEKVTQFSVTLSMDTGGRWTLLLAVPSGRLDDLLPGSQANKPAAKGNGQASDGRTGPFAQMPLPVEAVLGEISMTLSRLEKLRPGDEIPLAMPRDLPLRIGDRTIAHGVLGSMENQLALKLTRLEGQKLPSGKNATFDSAFATSPKAPPMPQPNTTGSTDQAPAAPGQRLEGLNA